MWLVVYDQGIKKQSNIYEENLMMVFALLFLYGYLQNFWYC